MRVLSDDGRFEYEITYFVPTVENLNKLWEACKEFKAVIAEEMRLNYNSFVQLILQPQTIVLQVADIGVVMFLGVHPGHSAVVDFLFWDKKLQNRQKVLLHCCKWAFEQFGLHRITRTIPRFAGASIRKMLDLGMSFEGMLRNGYVQQDKLIDLLLFSVLVDELTDEALKLGALPRNWNEKEWYKAFKPGENRSISEPIWLRAYRSYKD